MSFFINKLRHTRELAQLWCSYRTWNNAAWPLPASRSWFALTDHILSPLSDPGLCAWPEVVNTFGKFKNIKYFGSPQKPRKLVFVLLKHMWALSLSLSLSLSHTLGISHSLSPPLSLSLWQNVYWASFENEANVLWISPIKFVLCAMSLFWY